jgi:hypothetical protein
VISSDDPELDWARWATDRWARFPAGDVPRPLVLAGPPVVVKEAFTGPSKITFAIGAVDGDESVPIGVLDILRTPRISVDRPPSRANVQVKNARMSACDFLTDRGSRPFAAWQMECDDLVGSLWVLDPAVVALAWSPLRSGAPRRGPVGRGLAGTVSNDDREITFRFLGEIPNRVDYRSADVVETDAAVAIVPTPTYREPFQPQRKPNGGWAGVICPRSLTVHLGAPLGSRVLIDLEGRPVAVTPAV